MTDDMNVIRVTREQIMAAVDIFIADRAADDVLRDLWHGGRPDADLIAMLPGEQIALVSMVDRFNLTGVRAVVVLAAALRKTASRDGWIHYNLAKYLGALADTGLMSAKMPAIIHAMLAVEEMADLGSFTRALPLAVLVKGLSEFAPREAIRSALLLGQHGHPTALPVTSLAALDLPATGLPPSIPEALNVARALCLDAAATVHRVVSLANAADREAVKVVEPARIEWPAVPGDVRHFIFANANQSVELPGITVHAFSGATFSIDAASPGLEHHYLFDRSGDCVLEFASGTAPFVAETVLEYEEPVAILDDGFSGTMNICHFLLDRVTRIPIYDCASSATCKLFLVDSYPYYCEIFDRLGLSDRIITAPSKRVSISAPVILASSNIGPAFRHPAHWCAPWAISHLRDKLKVSDLIANPRHRIVISRTDALSRRILNWDEIMPVFSRHGFEAVVLSGMSLKAQMDLFSDAAYVIGVHGAGLTNILFAPRNCKVMEILPPLVAVPDYWLLATSLGQSYSALVCDDPELPRPDYSVYRHDAAQNGRDVIVPAAQLDIALTYICRNQ